MIVSFGSLKVAEVIANTKAATLKANVNTIKFVARLLRLCSVETSTAVSNIAIKMHRAYAEKSPVLTGFPTTATDRRNVTLTTVTTTLSIQRPTKELRQYLKQMISGFRGQVDELG